MVEYEATTTEITESSLEQNTRYIVQDRRPDGVQVVTRLSCSTPATEDAPKPRPVPAIATLGIVGRQKILAFYKCPQIINAAIWIACILATFTAAGVCLYVYGFKNVKKAPVTDDVAIPIDDGDDYQYAYIDDVIRPRSSKVNRDPQSLEVFLPPLPLVNGKAAKPICVTDWKDKNHGRCRTSNVWCNMKKPGYYTDGIPRQDCLLGAYYECNWGVYTLKWCPTDQRFQREFADWATEWSGSCKTESQLSHDVCDEEVAYYDVPP